MSSGRMNKQLISVSKFLSLVLRHKPEAIGLVLDEAGWASVPALIALARKAGTHLSAEMISEVIASNDKQRFALSPDGQRIRANQGHSIPVDLGLEPQQPPAVLYHGTATRFLDAILNEGLKPGNRQHVHLSPDEATASKVGKRHGKPVILRVDTGLMYNDGHAFYQSQNGVWLTAHVPPTYLAVTG